MNEQPSTAKPKHLLVVDDNAELAETYRELFEAHGYEVSLAGDGVEALKFILSHTVDGVLCDLSMPKLEGDEFHEAVEKVQPKLSRRFVFVTGNAGNPKFENFLRNASCPVLYKPVPMDTLIAAIQEVTSR